MRISKFTADRKSAWNARSKEPDWQGRWRAAIAKFPLKCFQDDPDGWKPDADWFLKKGSVTKILEGKYDWRKSNGKHNTEPGAGQRYIDGVDLGPV